MTDEVLRMIMMAFAFSLIGMSVYLSSRLLHVVDLTCDASVAIGGSAYVATVASGIHPAVAIIISTLLGACAGAITASLSSNLKIKTVVTSVITLVVSQVFVYRMCSAGNEALSNYVMAVADYSPIVLLSVISVIFILIAFLMHRIVNSEYGLAMRVYADGPIVAESLGINRESVLMFGLSINNALAALAGAFIVQISRTFYPTMGLGSFIFGLGVLLLVSKVSPGISCKKSIMVCAISGFVYKIVITLLAHCIGGTSSSLNEYEQAVAGLSLIMLIALTFSGKAPKESVLHM